MKNIEKIAYRFDGINKVENITENRLGHINNTYIIDTNIGKIVLQKINKNVFKKPEIVMNNIAHVTKHIINKLKINGKDFENGCLHFLLSNGKNYVIDECDDYWRAYHYIDGDCYSFCDSPSLFERVGVAFGDFQSQLSDFDATKLKESIPNFHNTVVRYDAFETALKQDVANRAKDILPEIEFVHERKDDCSFIVDGIACGKFPLRVTHNDTKLNNIIMDRNTGKGLCVIDLDTVMPGSMLYDYGDAIRFGASSAKEDETDLSKVYVNTEMFASFTKGYLSGLYGTITDTEIDALPISAKIITLEIGIRFLTDYLNGDTYFRTSYPTHNLDRARNQFKLVKDLEDKLEKLNEIIHNL